MLDYCPVFELRRYALKPGARETLIALFDREFVETQEAEGMRIYGQFRDLDAPDYFVWPRGFSDMVTRKRALEAFYTGPVWKAHAQAANATMLSVDNVLLLRPIVGLNAADFTRPAPGSTAIPIGLLAVTIYPLNKARAAGFPDLFHRELQPMLINAGITVLAIYITENSPNTFPALPVREDVDVFVWMTLCRDENDHARKMAALDASQLWRERMAQILAPQLDGAPEQLRLAPTARSLVHYKTVNG